MLPNIPILDTPKIDTIAIVKPAEPEKPKEVIYIIKEGDNLTKIAKAHSVDLKRLWAKNTELTNPDRIEPEKPLKIPQNDEQLADRPLPESVIIAPPAVTNNRGAEYANRGSSPSVVPRGAVAGNTYTPGQCTWYVKNLRPDIPNSWGNASSWLGRAQAMGWPTGREPRVGAIGWTNGHVVYVTGVQGNQVTITDMNGRWKAWEIGHYTYPASKYVYIY